MLELFLLTADCLSCFVDCWLLELLVEVACWSWLLKLFSLLVEVACCSWLLELFVALDCWSCLLKLFVDADSFRCLLALNVEGYLLILFIDAGVVCWHCLLELFAGVVCRSCSLLLIARVVCRICLLMLIAGVVCRSCLLMLIAGVVCRSCLLECLLIPTAIPLEPSLLPFSQAFQRFSHMISYRLIPQTPSSRMHITHHHSSISLVHMTVTSPFPASSHATMSLFHFPSLLTTFPGLRRFCWCAYSVHDYKTSHSITCSVEWRDQPRRPSLDFHQVPPHIYLKCTLPNLDIREVDFWDKHSREKPWESSI